MYILNASYSYGGGGGGMSLLNTYVMTWHFLTCTFKACCYNFQVKLFKLNAGKTKPPGMFSDLFAFYTNSDKISVSKLKTKNRYFLQHLFKSHLGNL